RFAHCVELSALSGWDHPSIRRYCCCRYCPTRFRRLLDWHQRAVSLYRPEQRGAVALVEALAPPKLPSSTGDSSFVTGATGIARGSSQHRAGSRGSLEGEQSASASNPRGAA